MSSRTWRTSGTCPNWNHAIESTTKTSPGPVGVGSTYRQIRSEPSRSEEGFEVTVFEPVSKLAIDGEIGPFHARLAYLIEPMEGATRLTNAVELEPSSTVSKLLAPFAGSKIKTAVAENLDALKRVLEEPDLGRRPRDPRRPPHRRPGSPMSSHPRSSRPRPASPRRRSNASSRSASWSRVTGAGPSERSTP